MATKDRRHTKQRSRSRGRGSRSSEPTSKNAAQRRRSQAAERIAELEQFAVDAGRLTGQYVQQMTTLIQKAIPDIVEMEEEAAAQGPDNRELNEAVNAAIQRGASVQDKVMDIFLHNIDQKTSAFKRK